MSPGCWMVNCCLLLLWAFGSSLSTLFDCWYCIYKLCLYFSAPIEIWVHFPRSNCKYECNWKQLLHEILSRLIFRWWPRLLNVQNLLFTALPWLAGFDFMNRLKQLLLGQRCNWFSVARLWISFVEMGTITLGKCLAMLFPSAPTGASFLCNFMLFHSTPQPEHSVASLPWKQRPQNPRQEKKGRRKSSNIPKIDLWKQLLSFKRKYGEHELQ